MRTAFHPYLPNGPVGDPVLWVDLPDEGHSVLLDLGDLSAIPHRKLLRVDQVIVTHTHIDHFIGFDHLLRLTLARRHRELVVRGPAGFLGHVAGKIAAYRWNLIESYPVRLRVEEIDGERIRSVLYSGAGGMRAEALPQRAFTGTLFTHRAYRLEAAHFDHGIPVLGVALCENEHLGVNKPRVDELGLRPGPWLHELKAAVRARADVDSPITAETREGGTHVLTVGRLADALLVRGRGQKLAYLGDMRHTAQNVACAVALARDADLLICESAFLHADAALAAERNHLTARQAGEIARAAGARRLATFHFSPRYTGRERELREEAAAAFGAELTELPTGPVE